jgi:aspartyl-tRNA(Asn)/glutamyl-tRNA(Gln) amidotransferase subunit C
MAIDRTEVARVARLARLALAREELDALAPQLDRIVEYVAQLADADSGDAGIERCAAPASLGVDRVPLRSDDDDDRPDALARPPAEDAPVWRDGFFLVPRLAAWDRSEEEP